MSNNLLNKLNIIAEIGQGHDGNLTLAHSYIDAVHKSGVSAIKFQIHIADYESSAIDKFRVRKKYIYDKSRFDYWKRTEFNLAQWAELKNHAEKLGLIFLCSPFSLKAVDILKKINIKAWKIGSGELNNFPLIEKISKTNKPIILSTGLSNFSEINDAVNLVNNFHKNIAIMQCTSLYPCPKNLIGLNVIKDLKERYKFKVGFSDHSGNPLTSLAAKSLGADFVEVHVVFNKNIIGFDTESSITIEQLKELKNHFSYLDEILKYKNNKNIIPAKLKKNKKLFEKSIFLKKNIISGKKIKFNDLDFRKPANGILARDFRLIIGKKIKKSKRKDSFLKKNDILI
jgi:N,N'-diacetyllegionaminate synthase